MPLKRTPPPTLTKPTIEESNRVQSASTLSLALEPVTDSSLHHCASAPDLFSSSTNITERKKRKLLLQHDNDNMHISTVIKDMFTEFSKEQEKRFQELQNTISTVNQQNIQLNKTVQLMAEKYDEFILKISNLEKERQEDKKVIKILEEKIENLERKSCATSIEIRNLPKKLDESKDTLCNTIIGLGKILDVHIDTNNVRDIYRWNSRDNSNPIVVNFNTTLIKEKILKSLKNYNKNKNLQDKLNTKNLNFEGPTRPVYVSECLTRNTQKIYFHARKFQRSHDYKFCWTSRGIVYLKKDTNSKQVRVSSESDIEALRRKE